MLYVHFDFVELKVELWIRIRIDFCQLDPDLDPCGQQ
jgi:hypothetical protein